MTIEHLLPSLSEEDRSNYLRAVSQVGIAFAARHSAEIDPVVIGALPQIRDHVLSGGEYPLHIEEAISALKDTPEVANKLISAEVEAAQIAKIEADIANMGPQQRMNYARERGLDRPRSDVTSTMTKNEHAVVLASLPPAGRIAYARRHGLA